jgi:uncharacterized protein with HEPN domain
MRPPSHDAAYLWDMLDAARTVLLFIGNRSFPDYLKDQVIQAAVERKIEIIGEAARRVSEEFKSSHPEIPWRGIIGQRHVLAHEYGGINHRIIWNLVEIHIPALVELLVPLVPPSPDEQDKSS